VLACTSTVTWVLLNCTFFPSGLNCNITSELQRVLSMQHRLLCLQQHVHQCSFVMCSL
jgi:hypothetical protein